MSKQVVVKALCSAATTMTEVKLGIIGALTF